MDFGCSDSGDPRKKLFTPDRRALKIKKPLDWETWSVSEYCKKRPVPDPPKKINVTSSHGKYLRYTPIIDSARIAKLIVRLFKRK